jgi:pyruvate,water dikinase
VERAAVDAARRDVPCLTDADVKAVAALARRAERHFGCPQDVEWAVDARQPPPGRILLLQSRPETVWSRQPPRRLGSGDYMSGIARTGAERTTP